MSQLEWVEVDSDRNLEHVIERAKVPNGWLVRMINTIHEIHTGSITFVPDENHEWKVDYEK